MKTKLGHIASIQTGVFAKPEPEGEIVYLQARHFDENGKLQTILHPDLKKDNISEKHLLHPGDVLFVSKGTKNVAVCYESKNQPAVASTSFFVIRLNDDSHMIILPGFLAWLINHPQSQKILKGNAIGSSMVSISKAVLEELEISIPTIPSQQKIVKIAELRNQEKDLSRKIETLREQQIQQQLINAIK